MENLIQVIQEAIPYATPFQNILPGSRPEFTKECKEAEQNAKQLNRPWRTLQTDKGWEVF